ncbi:MAG: hypothetical protein FWC90_04690 [Oscillospiraceae bacterium]|nr:hypothetical protein [Oscillospiraceae bacterium]
MSENTNTTHNGKCPTVASQIATISQPVEIRPFATTGAVTVECFGRPMVEQDARCERRGHCCFTITQRIRVEIPVVFGAEVEVGKDRVECARPRVEFEGEPRRPRDKQDFEDVPEYETP